MGLALTARDLGDGARAPVGPGFDDGEERGQFGAGWRIEQLRSAR